MTDICCDFWSNPKKVELNECALALLGESLHFLSSTEGRVLNFIIADNGSFEFAYSDSTELWDPVGVNGGSISIINSAGGEPIDTCPSIVPEAYAVFHSSSHRVMIPSIYWVEFIVGALIGSCTTSNTSPNDFETVLIAVFSDMTYSNIYFSSATSDINNTVVIISVLVVFADTTTESYIVKTVNGIDWSRVLVNAADSNDYINGIYTAFYNQDIDTGGFLSLSNYYGAATSYEVYTSNSDASVWTFKGNTLTNFDGSDWGAISYCLINKDMLIGYSIKNSDTTYYYVVFTNYGTTFLHKFLGPYPLISTVPTVLTYDRTTNTLFGLFPLAEAGLGYDSYKYVLHYSSDLGITWDQISDFSYDEYFNSYLSFIYARSTISLKNIGQRVMRAQAGYLTIGSDLATQNVDAGPWEIHPVSIQFKISEII